ncbi:MAG: hypothetical protein H0T79_00450 [Deltaproteobacteria bacterium]|nr:hypothetical protein [Deltaproteobacteria bacterium]
MRLSRTIFRLTGYSHLSADVRRLARTAEEFHEDAERGTTDQQLLQDFLELQREYIHMRGMVFDVHRRYHSPAVTMSWSRVAGRFETLALTTGLGSSQLCELPGHLDDDDDDEIGSPGVY